MKKLIFVMAFAVITLMSVWAEKGDMGLGVQFDYATKHSLPGLGLQFLVEPVSHFRIAPEFIYYFKNDNVSAYNLNLNLHYLIQTGGAGFYIYPLAGFSYAHFTSDVGLNVDNTWNRFGANVGCGAEYRISNSKLSFYTEQRFQILKDCNQSVTCLGMKYSF